MQRIGCMNRTWQFCNQKYRQSYKYAIGDRTDFAWRLDESSMATIGMVFAFIEAINNKMTRGPMMGDFNSYFFFATAAGLTAAAIVIAIVSAVEHFRDGSGVSRSESAALGDSDVGAE